ncbi:MBOAT family O-acyltransferase [Candidatus Riflebacteria bacterium]
MLFNSWHYLVFFPVVCLVYFSIPNFCRWAFLLAASYFFYACWRWDYLFLIIISTLIDYCCGLKMGAEPDKGKRLKFLIISLCGNLLLLFTFKYFNFFNSIAQKITRFYNIPYGIPDLDFLLPVGISFYTFQTLSYTIEVYRGRQEPEKHLGMFALYVSFFPQLVAGPIERSINLLPQFKKKFNFDYERFATGIQLIFWGLFKKVVIADRLSSYVQIVYGNQSYFSGPQLFLATFFFAFQIYCDFSGYSDIAIGSARILGFDLMENFNLPYFAISIKDFWDRWHISLSTWFRDYLYISLGGNRVSYGRNIFNLFVVFILSGLWHGANFTFIVWGIIHGFFLFFERTTASFFSRISNFLKFNLIPGFTFLLKWSYTFLVVLSSWIFFRAASVSEACQITGKIFDPVHWRYFISMDDWWNHLKISSSTDTFLGLIHYVPLNLILIGFLVIIQLLQYRYGSLIEKLRTCPWWFRWFCYYAGVLTIMTLGVFKQSQFIYFQF